MMERILKLQRSEHSGADMNSLSGSDLLSALP